MSVCLARSPQDPSPGGGGGGGWGLCIREEGHYSDHVAVSTGGNTFHTWPVMLTALETWQQSRRDKATKLIREHAQRTGPLGGDPFDAELWMAEAAELLELVTRFGQ